MVGGAVTGGLVHAWVVVRQISWRVMVAGIPVMLRTMQGSMENGVTGDWQDGGSIKAKRST
jgi:hypothetical protein